MRGTVNRSNTVKFKKFSSKSKFSVFAKHDFASKMSSNSVLNEHALSPNEKLLKLSKKNYSKRFTTFKNLPLNSKFGAKKVNTGLQNILVRDDA